MALLKQLEALLLSWGLPRREPHQLDGVDVPPHGDRAEMGAVGTVRNKKISSSNAQLLRCASWFSKVQQPLTSWSRPG